MFEIIRAGRDGYATKNVDIEFASSPQRRNRFDTFKSDTRSLTWWDCKQVNG
jgi:hypothetical protein